MHQDDQSNSREDMARLWVGAEAAVSAFVFSSIASFNDAEDVLQEVAAEVARRFEEYDHQRPFAGWVIWIAKSRIIDHYRRSDRQRRQFKPQLLDRLAAAYTEVAERRDYRLDALRHCLGQLPDDSRRMLDLRYGTDLSADEIAREMGLARGSVAVLLHRLRSRLAECVRQRLVREVV